MLKNIMKALPVIAVSAAIVADMLAIFILCRRMSEEKCLCADVHGSKLNMLLAFFSRGKKR